MSRSPVLERFDQLSDHPLGPMSASGEWRAGHAAGLAEAATAAAARQDLLRDNLVQAVADLKFNFAEARAHLLGALTPLFRTLAETVLPDIAQASLAPQVVDHLCRAAEADMNRPVHLCLSPEDIPVVETALARSHLPLLRVTADHGLAAGQACLMSGTAETVLDTPALCAAIRASLLALQDETDERTRHG
jgi:phage tail protein X